MTTQQIEARRAAARQLRQTDRTQAARIEDAVAKLKPGQVDRISRFSTARIGFVGNHR